MATKANGRDASVTRCTDCRDSKFGVPKHSELEPNRLVASGD
jgi:hypothetical protein